MSHGWMWLAILVYAAVLSPCIAEEWCTKLKSEETQSTAEEKIKNDKIPQCSETTDNLVSGRMVNGSSLRQENLLPPWVNLTLARQGQKWAIEHVTLLSGSHIFGLMFVLAFPDINAVLLFTNQSDTPDKAAKRYSSTINQVDTWYSQTLKEETGDNEALKSLNRVRGLHTAAMMAGNERLHLQHRSLVNNELYERIPLDEAMWTAFKKDLENSNIPEKNRKVPESYPGRDGSFYSVSQFQQAMTQFAFVGFPVLFPERLNIFDAKDEDLYAFNHLWAVLGYAIGIDDKYNVALQPDLNSTKKYYQKIFDEWYIPNLYNLDFHSKVLLEAQLKGFEQINDILTPRTLLLRLLRDVVNIPVPNMTRELSPRDHAKMFQFYIEGIRGFVEKIRDPNFRQSLREQGFLQKIKTKLQERHQ